jgi:uncharacterized protein (DUF2336 family)
MALHPMNAHDNLLSQLEAALAGKELSRRADVLRRVTDLFVAGSGGFSADQVELFDQVMGRLIENAEIALRAELSRRIATKPDAPVAMVRRLAFDDVIEVAGPVLQYSERLDDATLVENAETSSQQHLLAISGRRRLSEPVTDVLVVRGDSSVVVSTARNNGANFSSAGLSILADKSRGDGELARCLWSRHDIPRQTLVRIFTEASEATRRSLEAQNPRQSAAIRDAVAAAAEAIQLEARTQSNEHQQARSAVAALHAAGQLNNERLLAFAGEGAFDKVAVSLSLMCDLPLGLIERCLVQNRTEQILVLAKAIDLSWPTASALILLQAGAAGISREQLDQCFTSFSRLQPKTARTAMQFYRMRERAGHGS